VGETRTYYAELPVELLKIDRTRQRRLGKSKVNDIVKHFNRAALGTLIVVRRKDGNYYVADGQHRLAACRIVGMATVPCTVHEGLSLVEEAELFLECNNRRKNPSRIDNFVVKLGAGHQDAIDIKEIVEGLGLKLNLSNTSGSKDNAGISAIGALEYIYERAGKNGLRRILHIAKTSWPSDRVAFQAGPLRGLYVFIEKYDGDFEDSELIQKLQLNAMTVYAQKARALTEIMGGHASTNYARVFWEQYNSGKRSRRLENRF
jgi:hypothetical protein